MNQNGSDRPIPPEGAQSAPSVTNQAAPKSPEAPKMPNAPKKKSGGGVKSFLYGLLGGIVSVALVLCLGNFTPLLDSFKGATVS